MTLQRFVLRTRSRLSFYRLFCRSTARSFIRKVEMIRWRVVKRWARQILRGIQYLHSQDPPIIHRDLKCDNIFINGAAGDIRIGDLGLSTSNTRSQKVEHGLSGASAVCLCYLLQSTTHKVVSPEYCWRHGECQARFTYNNNRQIQCTRVWRQLHD